MRDVRRVLDQYAVLRLEACCIGPGDVCHPVGALPHVREFVETLGEDPPENKFACLESAWAYVAAVVASQILLVLGRPEHSTAAQPVEEEQIIVVEVLLIVLSEGKDPCGPMLDLRGEDSFSPVDEGKWRFTGWLGGISADGPENGW